MGKVLVVGAARSGLAAVKHLVQEGWEVLMLDRRPDPDPGVVAQLSEWGVPAVWGEHPRSVLEDAEELVLSPGVPVAIPFVGEAVERGLSVIGELELAHRVLRKRDAQAKILAVTGTNGKSTTTDLLAHLLRAADIPTRACGNLGTPLVEALNESEPGTVFALECSSYQLETVRAFRAEGAALLNLTPDHLARHGTMEGYLAAKLRIFERQGPTDLQLTPITGGFADLIPGKGTSARFGWTEPPGPGAWCDADGMLHVRTLAGQAFPLIHRSDLRIPGDHNVENALAAAMLAHHGGAVLEAIQEGLRTYPGLAHRIVISRQPERIRAYNDSKGTNVDATLTAIRALPGPLVLLLGGEDKGASYEPLRAVLEHKLRRLIFLGDAIPQLRRDLGDLPHDAVWAFDEAVRLAFLAAQPGDQVLLSPACASFDQFQNFEHRGNHFEAWVKRWVQGAF